MTLKNNKIKTTSITTMTFLVALILIPMNMAQAEETVILNPVSNETGYLGISGSSCATSSATTNLNTSSIWVGPRDYDPNVSAAGCYRAFVTWDTTQVSQTVSAATLSFDVQPDSHVLHNNNVNGVIYSLENDPSTASASTIQTDIAEGTLYLSANSAFNQVGIQTVQLNQNFVDDMNNGNGIMRIGIINSNESTSAFDLAELKDIKLELTTEITNEELQVQITDLQNQIILLNATNQSQQQEIDHLYLIWEDIRDTIINWLSGRP